MLTVMPKGDEIEQPASSLKMLDKEKKKRSRSSTPVPRLALLLRSFGSLCARA